MKKYLFVLAALIYVVAGAGCHRQNETDSPYATPEGTIRVYLEAMKQGDFEAALACYADAALSPAGIGVEGLGPQEIHNLFLKSLADNQGPYLKNEPTNLQAKLLTAEVTYELGGVKHTHTLVNQNGEWKIATDLTK